MEQYFEIYGSAMLTPKNEAAYFNALLNHKSTKPFSDLLTWHESDIYNSVKINFDNKEKIITIKIHGCFNKLGWYLTNFMKQLMDINFIINGSYYVYTDDGEEWAQTIDIKNNTISYSNPNSISKVNFDNSLKNIRIAYVNGYIVFNESYDSIKDNTDIKYLDESNDCNNEYFIYSDMDINKMFKIIKKYKKHIEYVSLRISQPDKHLYLEYKYENGEEKCIQFLDYEYISKKM